jgi:hypothetical protein
MAKPDAGGGNMYGNAQQAMAGANAMRQRSQAGNRFGQLKDKMAGANQMRNDWRTANPGAVPQFNAPAGKTMPDMGGQYNAIHAALGGLGGAPAINALRPAAGQMPAPGGHNFYSQRLAQSGMNPAESPTMIRRPMADQSNYLRQAAGQMPQGPAPDSVDPRAEMMQRMQAFRGFRG